MWGRGAAQCAGAVTDTPLQTPPGSDWLFSFRHGGLLQMPSGALGGASGTGFFFTDFLSHVLLFFLFFYKTYL